MKTKILLIVILICCIELCYSQTKSFAITKDLDTIPLTINKIRNSVKLLGEVNGNQVTYKAKDLISFNWDGSVYESVKIGGAFKRWMFAYKKISGDLNLYVFTKQRQNLHSRNDNIGDFVIGTEVPSNPGYSTVDRLYIRKQNEDRGKVHKLSLNWRKVIKSECSNCQPVLNKLSEKGNGFNPDELVKLYNEKCSHK